MNWVIQLIVFCIVLFLYIHVYHHLKTSSDLELYELDTPTKEQIEEVCDIRQPVKFVYNEPELLTYTELPYVEECYGVFDIHIRTNDVGRQLMDSPFRKTQDIPLEKESVLPFLLTKAIPVFQKDTTKQYYSEHNSDFLYETGMTKKYQYYDRLLRPHMVSSCNYDYIIGTNKTITPLRYHLEYRNYYLVTYGKVTITMIPPSYSKYLHGQTNYELFEFYSPVNVWNPQPQYKHDFEKVKTLTLTLAKGDILYIPAYWWYSIQFDELSSISVFQYRTYMNTIAMAPQLMMYTLQHANVKHQVAKIENTAKVMTGINVIEHAQTHPKHPEQPTSNSDDGDTQPLTPTPLEPHK